MRIVFLSKFQNLYQRGAENVVLELSKRLSEKFSVDILSGQEADSMDGVFKGKYDVVIPINGRLQAFKVSLGRLFSKHKILITGHSGIGWDDIWNITICKPDIFVSLTEYQAKWAKKWAWGTKVVKIPNGIDLDKFSPKGDKLEINLPRPIILSVGALTWYKHHERVVKAVRNLEASLLIVGEGEEQEKLERMGKDFLGERFKILKLKYEDMPKIYRSVNLFTLPSWSREAFGIAYLEALASGIGVVAPDDVSRREIIGEAGIFVDVCNGVKYAEALDSALKIDWGKKARAQAEKFSWEKIVRLYEELITSMTKS